MSDFEENLIKFDSVFDDVDFRKSFDSIWTGPLFVTLYNNTDEYIYIKTYDEKDAVRWISYETRKIAPKQAARLTARGNYIHIYIGNNQAFYFCKKGKGYMFDGEIVCAKPSFDQE